MIPLRTPATLKRVPLFLLSFCGLSFLLSIVFSHHLEEAEKLTNFDFVASLFVFPRLSLAILCLWYFWIFFPVVHKREPFSFVFEAFVLISSAVMGVFFSKDGDFVPLVFLWTTTFFGFAMRDQIWENVDTLVLGPRIFSVFEVPSYVHVFFYFFYLFLSNLFFPMKHLYGKSFYFLALVSFISGFLLRSIELKVLKLRSKSI